MRGRLAVFAGLLSCFVYPVQSIAAYDDTFRILSSRVEVVNKPAQTMRVRHLIETMNTPPGATIPKNKALSVTYGANSIARLARNAKDRTPASIVVAGAITAAGYFIDELTGQVTREIPGETVTVYDTDWGDTYHPGRYTVSSSGNHHGKTACETLSKLYPSRTVVSCTSTEIQPGVWSGTQTYHNSSGHGPYTNTYTGPIRQCTGSHLTQSYCQAPSSWEDQLPSTWEPVSDDDVTEVIVPPLLDLPPHQLDDLLKDPFGRPLWLDELLDALSDWADEVAGRDPNLDWENPPGRWVYTDPITGDQTETKPLPGTGTGNETETDPLADPITWQDDFFICDWVPIFCTLVDWLMDDQPLPPPQNMPYEHIHASDYAVAYNPGIGAGSCPSPYTTSYQGQNIEITFDTACWAASSVFKPILLMLASIMAGFILVGITKRA